jgi:flavodoxin/ferredoxin
MARCLLVCYSQGGSTNRIAEAIAKGLRAKEHNVDLHNLKNGPAPDVLSYDVLGIGMPAYYFRPPFLVTDYVNSLPGLAGKPFFVFVLHGSYLGDTGTIARRSLEQKGGKEIGYARYHSAGYFLGYLKQGYLFSATYPKPETFIQAEQFGQEIAMHFAGKEYRKPAYDGPTHFVYRIERFLTNRLLVRQFFSRLFRADRVKCSKCGLCLRSCPTRNIREDVQGYPLWDRDCILCFSCELKCPSGAVKTFPIWFLFWFFTFYNTRRAARDPQLELARVEHSNGKTRIVKS